MDRGGGSDGGNRSGRGAEGGGSRRISTDGESGGGALSGEGAIA